ncbi:MAG TPA: hypothetical protein VK013_02685 [Myxococcaceae bacterium]|nr:hypothetical protein [Myxococcaceae bacterium]
MSRFSPFALVLVSLIFSACGSVQAGDSCERAEEGLCDSDTAALICQGGTFTEIPCRGAGGCLTTDDDGFICNIKPVAGDACPQVMEGQGQCDETNENQLLKCEQGTWAAMECNGCFVSDSSVMCFQE